MATESLKLPACDPMQFRFEWESACGRELDWAPGQWVRIYRPAPSKGNLAVVGIVTAGAFGLVGGVMTGLAAGTAWVPLALLIALVIGVITTLIAAYLYREKEVTFNWRTNEARFRLGGRKWSISFSAIRRIVVRQRTRKRTGGGSTSTTLHGCEVMVDTNEGNEQIALSEYERSLDIAYQRTAPLAKELAEALGVPWERAQYP